MKKRASCGVIVAVVLLVILLAVLLALRACEADTADDATTETQEEPTQTEQDIAETVDMLQAIFTTYDLGIGETLYDFYPRSTGEWFAVGDRGTFAQTGDGGATWTSQQVPGVDGALRALGLYYDGTWVMLAGDGDRPMGTADGASFQDVPLELPGSVNDIYFSGPYGWLMGDDYIRHTGDNGLTWHDQFDIIPPPVEANSVTMTIEAGHFNAGPDFTGWVVGRDGIATTTDGGFTFEVQPYPGSHFLDVFSTDPQHVWVSGAGGLVWGSADGGASWTKHDVGTADDLYAIAFMDERYGFTVDLKGALYTTTDGGSTWDERTYDGGPEFDYTTVRAAVFPPAEGELPDLRVWGTGPEGRIGELDASFGEIFADGFESGDTSAWSD